MRIDGAQLISNPELRYRLDPGEPGFATRSPASRSTQLVTAQELRNRVRLQRQAIAEGRQVVFAHSKFTPGQDGAFSSVKGGLTTVASTERPQGLEQAPAAGPGQPADPTSGPQESARRGEPTDADHQSKREVEEERRQISVKLRQTEQALAETERPDHEKRDPTAVGAETSSTRLRYQVEELRRARAQLEARELMQRLADLQAPVEQAASQSQDQVLGLLGARAGSAPAGAPSRSGGRAAPPIEAPPNRGFIRAHAAGGLFNALV